MLASDFQRKLRRCNSSIRIYCGNDDSKPAGVYLMPHPEPLCGVDKHYVPEHPMWNEQGKLLKGGWRRVVEILIHMKLVDRHYANKVFGVHFLEGRKPVFVPSHVDHIQKELEACQVRNMTKTGKPTLSRTEIMDLATEISKDK